MTDLDKVIKGLELCITDMNRSDSMPCRSCPYGSLPKRENCQKRLVTDALALLKAQQPRVMTLEEALGGDECWIEGRNGARGYGRSRS